MLIVCQSDFNLPTGKFTDENLIYICCSYTLHILNDIIYSIYFMSKYERSFVISKEKIQRSFARFFPCPRSGLYV